MLFFGGDLMIHN